MNVTICQTFNGEPRRIIIRRVRSGAALAQALRRAANCGDGWGARLAKPLSRAWAEANGYITAHGEACIDGVLCPVEAEVRS
jgi:hypothetical protein